jgi:hypothetical protein
MLTATVRADGSSKFGENNKYGVFPSFAAGWRISEESFMQSSSLFSNLKLRAGWDKPVTRKFRPKITQALYTTRVSGTTSYPLAETGPYPAGTTFVRLANPNIQWEVSTQNQHWTRFWFAKRCTYRNRRLFPQSIQQYFTGGGSVRPYTTGNNILDQR